MRFLLLPLLFLAPQVLAQTAPLNDTGQTQCFEAGALAACSEENTGDGSTHPRQDGRFGRDPQAGAGDLTKVGAGAAGFDFTKIANNGDELPATATLGIGPGDWACTRDNVTGRVWEVKTPGNANQTFNFTNASVVHAGAVNTDQLCGYTDWRVPTRRELLSIVHYGETSPSIDTTFFPNTVGNWYWSSDIEEPDSGSGWVVSFDVGNTGTSNRTSSNFRVRLVRSDQPTPPSNFWDNSNGTVTDLTTELMWDRCSWGQTGATCFDGAASTPNWSGALAVAVTANAANHRGYSDWRLPNRTELESLVDITKATAPTIDVDAFPNTPSFWFWSSTVYAPSPAGAWGVSFSGGGTGANGQTVDSHVRLVRSGQSFDALAPLSEPPVSIPALSFWGLGLMGLLLGVLARRRLR